jgi:hypothetical protein
MIFLSARNREVAFKLPLCLRALIAVDAVSAADVRACDACFMSRVNWMSVGSCQKYIVASNNIHSWMATGALAGLDYDQRLR